MKAFEEWRDKQYDGCQECSASPPGTEWRAALEWYRDTMDEIEAHDLPLHGREVIEQELEDSE